MRYGRIKFTQDYIRKGLTDHARYLQTLFSRLGFVVLDTEKLFCENVIIMTGYSHLFDEIREGEQYPEYTIHIKHCSTRIIESVSVSRVQSGDEWGAFHS